MVPTPSPLRSYRVRLSKFQIFLWSDKGNYYSPLEVLCLQKLYLPLDDCPNYIIAFVKIRFFEGVT